MAAQVQGKSALRTFLEMIKFEHSIFALPFAMIGMMWGSLEARKSAWPGGTIFVWIVIAMVSCRTAAMAFNRIADRDIDAINPRTRTRAIPAGLLKLRQVNIFFFASCALFFVAAYLLGDWPIILSPVALGVTLFYSLTKRFTPLCHLILGLSLGIAPAASWIAASGTLSSGILPMVAAVMFWTAGFDIIYSLQDEEFDRQNGLRSIPETFGKPKALTISRVFHVLAIGCLVVAGVMVQAGAIYFLGVGAAAVLLAYEQSLVKPDDLSRVDMAFFTLNGFVAIGLFLFTFADLLIGR